MIGPGIRDDWRYGFDAARAGEPVSSCPYRPGTLEHGAWVGGWTDATPAHHPTDELEKIKAAARPDPTLEILDLPPPRFHPVDRYGDVSHLGRPDPVEAILGAPPLRFAGEEPSGTVYIDGKLFGGVDFPDIRSDQWVQVAAVFEDLTVSFATVGKAISDVGKNLLDWISEIFDIPGWIIAGKPKPKPWEELLADLQAQKPAPGPRGFLPTTIPTLDELLEPSPGPRIDFPAIPFDPDLSLRYLPSPPDLTSHQEPSNARPGHVHPRSALLPTRHTPPPPPRLRRRR